ncbi:luciferin 4-monooxygenase-like [Anopheles bellator]|uniref:luciferin 4-monooxygenase-like n=1 Tax=Anopheles bellator TaxID=139047 RepID=UPI002647C0F4|nr:luciferin 4-monooxygenase-like [Anopheles bellator]
MALWTFDEPTRTWYGRRQTPIYNPDASIGQVLNDALLRSRDNIVQIDMDTGARMTCGEFRSRMVRAVQNLTTAGLKPGDVAVMANNNSENVGPLACALITLGAQLNPLAPGFGHQDMVHMLRLTRPKIIFCDDNNLEVVQGAAKEAIPDQNPPLYVVASRRDVAGVHHAEDLLVRTGREDKFRPWQVEDSRRTVAVILCSSGTTGPPKGVCMSHAQLIRGLASFFVPQSEISFNFSPLYWATGMFTLLGSVVGSTTRLVTCRPFSPETFFEAVEQYRASFLFLAPSYASEVLRSERIDRVDFSSVHILTLGGSYVSDGLRDRLDRLLPNGRTYNGVGSSEAGGVATDIGVPRKRGAIGTPATNMAIRIVDESGRALGVGERGEVLAKFFEPFVGYYNNPEATRAVIDENGFTRSGDVAYIDEEGYLFLVDRAKDIFKYRGFHVSPTELEAIVEKLPGVAAVCVVGIPADADRTTELPAAVIVRSPGSLLSAREVIDAVEAQVSDFKRLRGGVHFVDALPKTLNGKVLRRRVLEMVQTQKQSS